MKTWMKVLFVTALFGIPAFPLGPVIWPPAAGGPEPSAGQMPFFVVLFAIEALAFGLGISFLAFGQPLVRKATGRSGLRAWAMYLSIGWLLVSWWPHDNLQIHTGTDLQGLLYIEYGFHMTLILSGLVLAYSFLSLLRGGSAGASRTILGA
jgi:hypothetical protein